MAITYIGAGGLYTHLGRLIASINSYLTLAGTTLPGDLATSETLFNGFQSSFIGLPNDYQNFQNQVVGWRQRIAQYANARLADYTTILSQLGLPAGTSLPVLLAALIRQMIYDAQTVKASVVTIGPFAPVSGNAGSGRLIMTAVLDGYNAPLKGSQPNVNYNALLSQLAVPSETMAFSCIADSQQNGLSEGAEQFSWLGAPAQVDLSYLAEGSGQGPTLTCANQYALLVNRDLETWSGNTPGTWTISAGSTLVTKDTSAFFRGLASLKVTGDGSTTFTMANTITSPVNNMRAKRRWLVGLAAKASAVPSAGNLVVKFTGTGYTASSITDTVQTVQISGTPAGGSYTLTDARTGLTTAGIAWNAAAAAVQSALRLVPGLECVQVTDTAGSPPNVTHQITFTGCPGAVPALTYTSSLTGGAPVIAVVITTPGVEGEQVNLPHGALPTTWAILWFWINTPSIVPSDLALSVSLTGPFDNTKTLNLDSFVLCPVQYNGGVGANVVAGTSRWLNSDRVNATIANDQGGKFMDYFRRHSQVQLPSVTNGSETIGNGLVV